ncbi:hypothetical protein RMATCC62417_14842 [Rhizopus microsporus]|nr:hypothetical protein RMATCC62417_14842 [Rhizopus microsporus]
MYTPEWIEGLVNFIQSDTHEVITHLWLSACTLDDAHNKDDFKNLFVYTMETRLETQQEMERKRLTEALQHMLLLLKNADTEYLAARVDQQLGSALTRPPFTKDEFMIGMMQLEAYSLSKHGLLYPKLYHTFKKVNNTNEKAGRTPGKNPLMDYAPLLSPPSDNQLYTQKCVMDASCFWTRKLGDMIPEEFDLHMKNLIIQHYPTEQKTILDLTLANWAVRDRFRRHRDLIIDAVISLLKKPRYNNRTAPFYAFIQLFNLQEEQLQLTESNTYKVKSGALIDVVQFGNCADQSLVEGCLLILKRITEAETTYSSKLENWVGDCLRITKPDVAQRYIEWLCKQIREKQTHSIYARYLLTALKDTPHLSIHIVPVLLRYFDEKMLHWLLTSPDPKVASKIFSHYFGDGAQASKHLLVHDLYTSKSSAFMNKLFSFLSDEMSDTSPSSPKSRAWFKNHFLGPMLSVAGRGGNNNVAAYFFRQFFKTSRDFEWYFQTPLVDQQLPFSFLDISKSHDIYTIRHTGLASALQEMARLEENEKKELVKMWFSLWTAPQESSYRFTAPVSWILQCSGLYDQAPVVVKQMIKQFIKIGMDTMYQQDSLERSFVDRMMDLVLLSDTPEPDSLFDLFLSVAIDESTRSSAQTIQEQIMTDIVNVLVEISEELEIEMKLLSTSAEQQPTNATRMKEPRRKVTKRRNIKKMRKLLLKQQAELEESLQKSVQSGERSVKALTTLAQRALNFLLSLLNQTAVDNLKQDIQYKLIHMPLFYEPLAKLASLIRQPEDLQEDIQTMIETSLGFLKNHNNENMYTVAQNILQSAL